MCSVQEFQHVVRSAAYLWFGFGWFKRYEKEEKQQKYFTIIKTNNNFQTPERKHNELEKLDLRNSGIFNNVITVLMRDFYIFISIS